jgi:hypothetical protein
VSLALVRKELREHGWVIAAVLLFDALSLLGQLATASDQGGRFVALVHFTGVLGTLSALVAAERLFAREYGGQTQLFLEVLPVSRARVLATKWALGAGLLLGLHTAAWAGTLGFMRRTEVISDVDAARALLPVSAFALAVWSFSAMAGLLGRYRWVAWMAVALFYVLVGDVASVPFREAPLLRLLDESIAMARTPLQPRALGEAALVVALCVLATAALGLGGSGALAAALAGRMTSRERVFIIAAVIVVATVTTKLKRERELPPFELARAVHSTSTRNVVGVMTTEDLDAGQARELAETVARDVASLADALGLEARPPVFVLPQRGLDPTETQRATLVGAQGIVVRAAPDAEPGVLRARVLHELLGDASRTRALKEDRHVLLDGLAMWWVARDDPALRERWWYRAAAADLPLAPPVVTRWEETSEHLGTCLANALAFGLVDTLMAELGRDRSLALGARLFSPPSGQLAWLREPSPRALLESAGTGWEALTTAAEARRQEVRRASPDGPWRDPPAGAEVAFQRTPEGDVVAVHVSDVERWRVLYGRLGPWSRSQLGLARLDVRGRDATLPLTLARGDRLLGVVEHDDARLGCPVRLAVRRLEVP